MDDAETRAFMSIASICEPGFSEPRSIVLASHRKFGEAPFAEATLTSRLQSLSRSETTHVEANESVAADEVFGPRNRALARFRCMQPTGDDRGCGRRFDRRHLRDGRVVRPRCYRH